MNHPTPASTTPVTAEQRGQHDAGSVHRVGQAALALLPLEHPDAEKGADDETDDKQNLRIHRERAVGSTARTPANTTAQKKTVIPVGISTNIQGLPKPPLRWIAIGSGRDGTQLTIRAALARTMTNG